MIPYTINHAIILLVTIIIPYETTKQPAVNVMKPPTVKVMRREVPDDRPTTRAMAP